MGQREGVNETDKNKDIKRDDLKVTKPIGYSRLILFFVILAGLIYLIVSKFDVVGNILLVVIGIGAMILIHEFGHFIVAKLSDINVEAFSMGFPPILAGIRRTEEGFKVRILPDFFPSKKAEDKEKEGDEAEEGERESEGPEEIDEGRYHFTFGKGGKAGETEYRIGLVPFGGFVKMLGQEDTGVAEKNDDPRDYRNKSVGVRMAVIAAGVTFNALSAALVFMLVFSIGINMVPAVVGGVRPDSPAERAGLRGGDEIIEIAGRSKNLEIRDIMMAGALSKEGREVAFKVRHKDGSVEDYGMVAEEMSVPGQAGKLRLFGFITPQTLEIAKVSDSEKLFEETGLRSGDKITAVDGKEVDGFWDLGDIIPTTYAKSVTVLVERGGGAGQSELIEAELKLEQIAVFKKANGELELGHICSIVPRLRISSIVEDANLPALREGDIILAVGDIENPTYKEFRKITEGYKDKKLPLKILRRDGAGAEEVLRATVVPKAKETAEGQRVIIGITLELAMDKAVVAKTVEAEGIGRLEIPSGARITAVNGAAVKSFYDAAKQLSNYRGKDVRVDYLTGEQLAGSASIKVGEGEDLVTVKSVLTDNIPFMQLQRLYKAGNPIEAVGMGLGTSVKYVKQAYLTLSKLVRGKLSPKSVVGPVGIVAVSYKVASQASKIYYIYFLGLISTFIAVVNLVPILPFDGGHLFFLAIEKIKGSPVSEKIQEKAVYAGLVLVGGFVLYVTWQDIVRIMQGVFF